MAQIQPDTTLGGRYHLLTRIASGGMGTVWRARDAVLDRPVAVKILIDALGHDARFVERFRREARAAAGLSHRNIAGVYDYGEDGATPFIVMELLDGETLADRIDRESRIPPSEAATIARHVAEALQVAHEAGIVHRDVKPGNVMLTRRGEVKVMDFGIAATSWAVPLTTTGTTMGTAPYLSPEQASGERATTASDVYALGCVLYEMLTGRAPFSGDTPVAVATAHVQAQVPPVRLLAPDVPPDLAAACERALAKDPTARPASAAAFAALLAGGGSSRTAERRPGWGGGASGPHPTTPALGTPSLVRRPRRRWVGWVLISMLLALVLAVGLMTAFSGGRDGSPRNPPQSPTAAPNPPSLEVPQVVGLPANEAAARIREAGLVPSAQVVRGDLGVVRGVQPGEGTSLEPGDSVTLFIGNGHGGQGGGGDEGDGD